MRSSLAALWILALAAAFTLGRLEPVGIEADSLLSLESFREAVDQRNPLARSFAISRFLRQLDAEKIDGVVEAIEARQRWFSERDHLLLMTAWIDFDEQGAMDWAFSQPGRFRRRATAAFTDALAFRNAAAARFLVDTQGDPVLAELLHDHMVKGLARSERKDELTEYIMHTIQPGDHRQKATNILTLEILKSGEEALIKWAEEIPDDASGNYKRTAFAKAANALAVIDPARAAQWIEGHQDRAYAEAALELIARRWAEWDPAGALDWLATLSAGKQRIKNVRSVFQDWLEKNPKQAETWLRSASPAEEVDPAVRVMVRRNYRRRPALALDWAHRIQNPTLRQRVLTEVGRSWFLGAPEAFKAWLPESGLEKRIQDEILSTRRRTGRTDAGPQEATLDGGSPDGS
jgi:hypothetical protein